MEVADRSNTLAPGDMLGCYRIEGLLGKGGFGLTYLAVDTSLEMSVAIKEYMPEQFASRASDSSVRPRSPDQSDIFGWGLKRFISEARTLAKFRHPNIVRVLGVFERNRTAYMVMEHERGVELKHLLKRPEFRTETNLKRIVGPVMDGLAEIHRHDYIHRDIKPANILIREDRTPVLLDFGSARQSTGAQTQALTSLVSEGYAPLEQYDDANDNQQGPWTDIYALGAVLYFSVTGTAPANSTVRGWAVMKSRPDPLVSLRQLAPEGYGAAFCDAVDWALQLDAADRPRSIDTWRRHLLPGDETVAVTRERRPRASHDTTVLTADTAARRERGEAHPISRPPPPRARDARTAADRFVRDDATSGRHERDARAPVAARPATRATTRAGAPAAAPADSASRRGMIAGVALSLLLAATAGVVTRDRWLPTATEFVPGIAGSGADREAGSDDASVAARQAETERREAAAREAEEVRQGAAARQAEIERQEAAAREAEEARQAAAARQAEIERQEAAAREAEEARQAAAARQAEIERQEAAAREAEEARQVAAARQAETERREAAAREAEEARQAAVARQAELERREAAAREAEERALESREQARTSEPDIDPTLRISGADLNAVTRRFNALRRAIQRKDKAAMRELTVSSERKYAYFDYLFDSYETIDVTVSGVQASRRDQTVRAVLGLERMVRRNGNIALPPPEFRKIPLHSTRQGEWSDIHW